MPVTVANVADARAMESAQMIERFKDFLSAGDRGYYAYRGESVVHRSWVQVGPRTTPIWLRYGSFPLNDGDALVHFSATAPEYRGQGIYVQVLAHVLRQLQAQNYRRCFALVEMQNTASRRAMERAGMIPYRHFWVVAFCFCGFSVGRPSPATVHA